MISRVIFIIFAIYVGMVQGRINSKNKKTEAVRQSAVEKYWDVGEDRELYTYMSASYGYGYQGSARNNALFWKRKSNS